MKIESRSNVFLTVRMGHVLATVEMPLNTKSITKQHRLTRANKIETSLCMVPFVSKLWITIKENKRYYIYMYYL